MAKIPGSQCRGSSLIPGWGTRSDMSSHAITKDPACHKKDPAQSNESMNINIKKEKSRTLLQLLPQSDDPLPHLFTLLIN